MHASVNPKSATGFELRLALALALIVSAWRLWVLARSGLNLSFDEAQYWLWAQTPAFGYYSKPPLVAWLIGLAGAVCGEAESCVRLPSTLAYGVGSLFVFLIGRALYGPRLGLWSGAVFLTLPGVSYSAMLVTTDPPLLMFWALALFALIRALETGRKGWWILLGLAIGFGLLAKYAMILFVLSFALHLAWSKEARRAAGWRHPALAGAIALLLYAPNFFWNLANNFASYRHTGDNANLGGSLFHPEKLAEFLGAQFGIFGPIFFAVLLIVLARIGREIRDPRTRLLLAFILPLFVLMCVQGLLSRANANWAAPIYVAAGPLVVAWLADRKVLWLVRVSVVAHVVLAGLLYNFDSLARTFHVELSPRTDLLKRLRGWEVVGAQISDLLAVHPGARLLVDERKLMASLIYYVRPHPFAAVKWNPDGKVRDTFDLGMRLDDKAGGDYLLVSERGDVAEMAARFGRAAPLGLVRHQTRSGHAIELKVWRLEGFKGYRDAPGG